MYDLVKRYKELLNNSKIAQIELSSIIKVDIKTLRNFVNRGTTRIETLKKIADYFNVPIEYFFVKESQQKNVVFYHMFEKMNENQKQHIIDMMESINKNGIS